MIKRLIYVLKYFLKYSFIRFAIVGFLGIITNLIIFFIFADIFKLWANVSAVTAFLLAGIQNYILHHKWTFNETTCGEKISFYSWIKFNMTSVVGLGVNLIVLNIVLYFFTVPYKVIAQCCGVGSGTVLNYLGSKYFVFNKDKFVNKEKESVKKL
jgi:putative flippase GtrA